ncbi:MAG: lyase family protein [Chitinophagales bacterium]
MQKKNYISSIFQSYLSDNTLANIVSGESFIQKMLQFEMALAKCQAELDIIPKTAAQEIITVVSSIQIQPESLAESTRNNGIPTIELLNQIKAKLSASSASYLHYGATSQDVIDTAYVLMIKESIEVLEARLKVAIQAFGKQLQANKDIVIVGRTRTQQAVPLTLGIKIANWINPLIHQYHHLEHIKTNVLRVQLGGAVGSLSTIKDQGQALNHLMAKELQLQVSFPWHNDGSTIAEFTNWLTIISATIAKIAKDILTLSQTEIGEVIENKNGGGKSSTMPHKNNPILSEAIVALGNQNIQLNAASQASMINMNERDAVAWMAEWLSIPHLIVSTGTILNHAVTIGQNMAFQTDKIEHNLQMLNGLIYSEAASFELQKYYTKSEAKKLVGNACELVMKQNIGLATALKEVCKQEIDWESIFSSSNQKGISDELVTHTLTRIAKI